MSNCSVQDGCGVNVNEAAPTDEDLDPYLDWDAEEEAVANEHPWYQLIGNARDCPECKRKRMEEDEEDTEEEDNPEEELAENKFCATGEGGGLDPTCKDDGDGSSEEAPSGRLPPEKQTKSVPPPVEIPPVLPIVKDQAKKKEPKKPKEPKPPKKPKEPKSSPYIEVVGQTPEDWEDGVKEQHGPDVEVVKSKKGKLTAYKSVNGKRKKMGEWAAGKNSKIRNNELVDNQPSAHLKMSPEKACKILKDGSVHGHPLTQAQRGMFGALCGQRKKPTKNEGNLPEWAQLITGNNCGTGAGGFKGGNSCAKGRGKGGSGKGGSTGITGRASIGMWVVSPSGKRGAISHVYHDNKGPKGKLVQVDMGIRDGRQIQMNFREADLKVSSDQKSGWINKPTE